MKTLQPDVKILLAVVVALAVLSVAAVLTAPATNNQPLNIHNDKANGALALQLWLNQSGYKTSELTDWTQLDRSDVLFLLDPPSYSDADGMVLRQWVSRGHTLIIASDSRGSNAMLKAFDLSLEDGISGTTAQPAAPTLHWPSFSSAPADTLVYVKSNQAPVANQLYAGQFPVLVSEDVGQGRLWLSSDIQPFTNRGLHDSGSARLVANLLANVRPAAAVGFGAILSQTLGQWLTSTPPGVGILAGFGLTLVFLASQGRRFGRAVPLPDERLRRESVEYIYAIATLFRRSGQRAEVLTHFEQRLRRQLAARYGIDPKLNSRELVSAIVYHDPTVNEAALRHVLQSLARTGISEAELVSISSELDRFLRNLS